MTEMTEWALWTRMPTWYAAEVFVFLFLPPPCLSLITVSQPFPDERLREARDRPVIDTGAPGRRLVEQSGDRPPPAVDEGKSWLSLRMGIIKGKLKGFAMETLKNTKWAQKEREYNERQAKMAEQYKVSRTSQHDRLRRLFLSHVLPLLSASTGQHPSHQGLTSSSCGPWARTRTGRS